MKLNIPLSYKVRLAPETMEQAIKFVKDLFELELAKNLDLRRVTAPLFVFSGSGINDDLNGVENAVSFGVKDMGGVRAEVVHSLAKWKRMKLGAYGIPAGYGLYTDMNAIRADEELSNIHSLYVDQWDWERTINNEQRNQAFLMEIVNKIFNTIKSIERKVYSQYSHITPCLPETITFIHSEELVSKYPNITSKQREYEIAKEYGAVFIIGIGNVLSNGEKHDGRAPDYDDWSLNGDIIFWNEVLQDSFEISSMGIRVNKESLKKQLELTNSLDRLELKYHKSLMNDEIPLSIGGGIGQSRLCMYLLRCAHIGEVQSSLWPEEMIELCRQNNIFLK